MALVITEFSAPWSASLRLLTIVAVLLLAAVMVLGLLVASQQSRLLGLTMSALPVLVLCGSLLCMVRGYVLTARHLEVRRLLWRTPLPIAGLDTVTAEPRALRGSLRLFGNGGLFAITGWFWNRRIGRFRVYATDPQRAVLLRYRDGACVLVTPRDVQHFILEVRRIANIL
ncbi:MAG TPA: PH domain-containing protein [Steroidobacteraceae bacterium]|nr:PH domain-containing protein [Steroidobacteraceae bacterium]